MAPPARGIVACDRRGALERAPEGDMMRQWILDDTDPERVSGSLTEGLRGAEVSIGVSVPGLLTGADIATTASDAVVSAVADPVPEVPYEAVVEHATVVATGRSDVPNQIDDVLALPGSFRGLRDAGTRYIDDAVPIAAATAIADSVGPEELDVDDIVPGVLDATVAPAVAEAQPAARG